MAHKTNTEQECKLIKDCQSPAWCGVMRTWCTATVERSGRRSQGKNV